MAPTPKTPPMKGKNKAPESPKTPPNKTTQSPKTPPNKTTKSPKTPANNMGAGDLAVGDALSCLGDGQGRDRPPLRALVPARLCRGALPGSFGIASAPRTGQAGRDRRGAAIPPPSPRPGGSAAMPRTRPH